jgi:hypothetical protein
MSSYDYSRQVIKELSDELIDAGFRVFIAESGTYGFYTDKSGERVVSFQVDYLSPVFSGNYKSKHCGTGWRFERPLEYDQMLNAGAPYWATKGERIRYTSLDDHLNQYQASSKYSEVLS